MFVVFVLMVVGMAMGGRLMFMFVGMLPLFMTVFVVFVFPVGMVMLLRGMRVVIFPHKGSPYLEVEKRIFTDGFFVLRGLSCLEGF